MIRLAVTGSVTAVVFSCSPATVKTHTVSKQFDLPAFFKGEITRLSSENPQITKTVIAGNQEEANTLQIKNWEEELATFANLDLNKPVYQEFIRKDSLHGKLTLTFANPSLDISWAIIYFDADNQAYKVEVEKKSDNLLYDTREILSYHKDKAYSIEKMQKVWLMTEKHYSIKGAF